VEELIYYGILILFYLYSSYRSSQKRKQSKLGATKASEFDFSKKESRPQNPIFDFGINLEDNSDPLKLFKEAVEKEKKIEKSRKDLEIVLNQELPNDKKESTVDDYQGLAQLKHKSKKVKSNKLLEIQKQYQNQPFKLAIVMKAILDEPIGLQSK
jgi:hypothetical protein